METLKRQQSLLLPQQYSADVSIDIGLTRTTQFNQWLEALPPRFCARHIHTRLIVDREASKKLSLSCENNQNWYRRYMTPGSIVPDADACQKLYAFEVVLRCPTCRVAYARCPPEFHETDFDSFDISTPERATALAKAREFAAQVNQRNCGFAVFVGMPGTGKTRLACNIIRELHRQDALYLRQGELTTALRRSYSRKDVILHRSQSNYDADVEMDESQTLLEMVQGVSFLVLDEIGCTAMANDERLLLDELLKHRFEHRKPTILISNLPLNGVPDNPGVKQFLGDAPFDRIAEASGNGKFIVQLGGISFRRTAGENYLNGLG